MHGIRTHARLAAAVLAGAVLVGAHAALAGLAFGGRLSLAVVVGIVALLAVKYAWSRLRH